MMATEPRPSLPRLYLLDVEGTVSPISLVTEQLFPYARAHFESFLRSSIAELEKHPESFEQSLAEGGLLWDLAMLHIENRPEQDPDAPSLAPPGFRRDQNNVSMTPSAFIPVALKYVFWLMDRDRKSTALKSLQGKIWKTGFESGELKGTLFADVPRALERWAAHGRVAIYSSGSASAQELLFRYSIFGDLTGLIAGYFDTRIGAKIASASYKAIAAELHVEPREVCFFSDVVRELDPAREAGLETRLVVREGNAPVEDPHGHVAIESFDGDL
jgi:2,3-diketo-5-methylthio-1-phosphopentane phosphatase